MIKFCNLFSGSTGNCTYISTENTKILIDAGVSCAKISKSLGELDTNLDEIDAILITHEHTDHTKGLTTIAKKHHIPIYTANKTWNNMTSLNIAETNKFCFTPNEKFEIGDFEIYPFSIPHDAADPCGFSISAENKKITLATDIGHLTKDIVSHMENSDILLIESNYDTETLKCGSYPYFLKERILGEYGHLSNETASKAIAYLCKNGVNNIILGHLSKENNFPELAYQTAINELNDAHLTCNLTVANRDCNDTLLTL
ncbi:MAG: MBL fold metallo-hydrolase [Clostridia bacterium]|nr:MBL fold metallo-hydrolase [Clostridia bacterium]